MSLILSIPVSPAQTEEGRERGKDPNHTTVRKPGALYILYVIQYKMRRGVVSLDSRFLHLDNDQVAL
jgi:hypothetical protein